MLSRREMLRGAIAAGGAVSLSAGASAKAEAPPDAPREAQRGVDPDREGQTEIAKAIRGVDDVLLRSLSVSIGTPAVGMLRKGFETFVRSHGKFPDFNEVGIGIFFAIYDWHIKNRQVLTVQRQPDNRYTMQFMFTQLVLRYDYDAEYVGPPYDNR